MIDALSGEFTFINFLSILAFLTTVGLFFCGIPICRQIWKRKDTSEISGAPFLMGVLGGTCWLTYGSLKKDQTVQYVTSAQVILYGVYTVFYFFMTKKKFWITIKIIALVTICVSLVLSMHFFGMTIFHPLGIICMTLNVGDFAAPLAGLRVVIRRRATSTLPLPLCIANFMVSTEWFIYGLLVKDFYLILPNGIGSFLAFIQLILFVVLPRKPNQRAPALRLYDCVRRCGTAGRITDIESAAVVPVDKTENNNRVSKHRWSTRMITNMAGEIENVIQKVHLGDQFGYSMKLNKEDEENSTDSVNLENGAVKNGGAPDDTIGGIASGEEDHRPIVFPMTIKDERQLFNMSKRILRSKKSINSNGTIPELSDLDEDFDALPIGAHSAPRALRGHVNFAHSAYDNGIRNIALDERGQKFVLMRKISESDDEDGAEVAANLAGLKRSRSAPNLAAGGARRARSQHS